jgi:type II secretory pathway component PulF
MILLCRVLRHSLGAGLMLRDVFRQQAIKGPSAVRPIAARISEALEKGDDLETALKPEQKAFPPLFMSLAVVGESTGNMPEIFKELEKYYIMQQKHWRQFWTQALWPILQLVAAIFVISAMIYILGMIAQSNNAQPMDPLGIGLTGTNGAITFFFSSFGTIGAIIVGYMLLSRSLEGKAVVDRFLLTVPGLGGFLMALVLMRFALSLRLTLETGMSIVKAVGLSLRATGNAAFASKARVVQDVLRSGDSLANALAHAHIFPDEFVHMVSFAEEGGRVPEVMVNQAEQYEEEAVRRLAVLTKMANFLLWAFVALMLIISIFRLYSSYFGMLDRLTTQ